MVGKHDFEIIQGSTFEPDIVWKNENGEPVSLNGWTARMQIRQNLQSPSVLHELTTENGGISIDGPNGKVNLSISAAVTAGFTWRRGVYDLELVSPAGKVRRLLEGRVTVSPEVTR